MMLGKCERCGGDHYATECQSGCEAVTPTPEERAAAVVSRWVGYPQADAMPQTVRDISDAIRSAVLAERARCAGIVLAPRVGSHAMNRAVLETIAAEIERGKP